MNEYLTQIKKVIQEKTGHEAKDVQDTSYFEDDLNIGETELSEILAELEEIYQVDLVEEQGNIETVQDLVELISEQIE